MFVFSTKCFPCTISASSLSLDEDLQLKLLCVFFFVIYPFYLAFLNADLKLRVSHACWFMGNLVPVQLR